MVLGAKRPAELKKEPGNVCFWEWAAVLFEFLFNDSEDLSGRDLSGLDGDGLNVFLRMNSRGA